MAFQIFKQQQRPSLGETLGTSLGTGLGAGIQDVLQQRMQSLDRGRQAKGLQALLGVDEQKADAMSNLPPQLLQEYVKGAMRPSGTGQTGLDILKLQQTAQALLAADPNMSQETALALAGDPQIARAVLTQNLKEPQERAYAEFLTGKPSSMGETSQEGIAPKIPDRLTSHQAEFVAKQKQDAEIAARKEQQGEKKLLRDDINRSWDRSEPIRKDVIDQARTWDKRLNSLGEMERLIKDGNLPDPTFFSILKKMGADDVLLSQDTPQQVFKSLVKDFITGAKDVFGGRVTNFELEQFLTMLPSLANTPEGNVEIIKNLKKVGQAAKIEAGILEKIEEEAIREGKPLPLNLRERLYTEGREKIDKVLSKVNLSPYTNQFNDKWQSAKGELQESFPEAPIGYEVTIDQLDAVARKDEDGWSIIKADKKWLRK